MLAKVMNCHWSRWENFWATEQTSVVHLADAEAIFDKLIYTLTNVVKDHQVARASDWPGASSLVQQLNDVELVAQRPKWFFSEESTMPEQVRLRFTRPKPFAHLTHEQWADKIRTAIAEVERQAAAEREKNGTRVRGRKRVLAQSAFSRPASHEPRREMSPRVASRNKWARIEALQRNKAFLCDYRDALEAYRAGDPDAVFPAGTYQLWEHGNVVRDAA